IRDFNKFPFESIEASTFYMWSSGMPLQDYMLKKFNKDSQSEKHKKWASMGSLYAGYGIHLIKTYPLQFAEHFLWPNALKYYAPPIEFMEQYNMGKDSVDAIAQTWFGYKSNKVNNRQHDAGYVYILDFYPILTGTANVIFLCCLICF